MPRHPAMSHPKTCPLRCTLRKTLLYITFSSVLFLVLLVIFLFWSSSYLSYLEDDVRDLRGQADILRVRETELFIEQERVRASESSSENEKKKGHSSFYCEPFFVENGKNEEFQEFRELKGRVREFDVESRRNEKVRERESYVCAGAGTAGQKYPIPGPEQILAELNALGYNQKELPIIVGKAESESPPHRLAVVIPIIVPQNQKSRDVQCCEIRLTIGFLRHFLRERRFRIFVLEMDEVDTLEFLAESGVNVGAVLGLIPAGYDSIVFREASVFDKDGRNDYSYSDTTGCRSSMSVFPRFFGESVQFSRDVLEQSLVKGSRGFVWQFREDGQMRIRRDGDSECLQVPSEMFSLPRGRSRRETDATDLRGSPTMDRDVVCGLRVMDEDHSRSFSKYSVRLNYSDAQVKFPWRPLRTRARQKSSS